MRRALEQLRTVEQVPIDCFLTEVSALRLDPSLIHHRRHNLGARCVDGSLAGMPDQLVRQLYREIGDRLSCEPLLAKLEL